MKFFQWAGIVRAVDEGQGLVGEMAQPDVAIDDETAYDSAMLGSLGRTYECNRHDVSCGLPRQRA